LKGPLCGRVREKEGKGREGKEGKRGEDGKGGRGRDGKGEGEGKGKDCNLTPQLVFHTSDTV
jgi:hypothetical protein